MRHQPLVHEVSLEAVGMLDAEDDSLGETASLYTAATVLKQAVRCGGNEQH